MEKFGCSLIHYYSISRKYVNMKWGDQLHKTIRPRKDIKLLEYFQSITDTDNILDPKHIEYAKKYLDISEMYFYELAKKFRECEKSASLATIEAKLNKMQCSFEKYVYKYNLEP